MKARAETSPSWMALARAARMLDVDPTTFRRHLERNVMRDEDGSHEARFDGIIGRKIGGRWRVHLGEKWLAPELATLPRRRANSSSADPGHTGRPERRPA